MRAGRARGCGGAHGVAPDWLGVDVTWAPDGTVAAGCEAGAVTGADPEEVPDADPEGADAALCRPLMGENEEREREREREGREKEKLEKKNR